MPRSASVRLATPADLPAVADLVRQYWAFERIVGFDAARITALLQGLLDNPTRGACWVAEERDRPVGYLLVSLVFSLEHGGVMAEIDEFYLLEPHRGTGLGATMLALAEQHLTAAGIIRLQLQLGDGNHAGRRFYQRRGFSPRADFALWDKPLPVPTRHEATNRTR